ncbi:MAG: hypothetical protein ABIP64_02405 [Burkholderiales bacterium]
MFNEINELEWALPLSLEELDQVAGGRFKIFDQGLDRYEVYYDDGISISTKKPLCSNV